MPQQFSKRLKPPKLCFKINRERHQKPVRAEVSFKYEDESANYTKKVVNRAKASFDALQSLTDGIDPNSKTKTKWGLRF